MITPQTIKNRYPTVYGRSNKKTVDSLINELILEAYVKFSNFSCIDSGDYNSLIRLFVVSELQKEIDRSARDAGTTGLETSRSVPGEYSIGFANNIPANTSFLDAGKNEYEIEIDRILRQYNVPFIVK